jgi:hypothetical protein
MISVAIMAHPDRAAAAEALAIETGAQLVWDEVGDEWDTGRRALAAFHPDASHHVVLQDDAIPILGFLEHAIAAIAHEPSSLISFYLGTSKPRSWQPWVDDAIEAADREGAAWLSCERLLHGVALALPVEDIQILLAAELPALPYDERIGHWFAQQGRPSLYTWPSLVDHADGDTLVAHADGQPRTEPRRARRLGTPATWATETIAI